jgi:hypothetical protein
MSAPNPPSPFEIFHIDQAVWLKKDYSETCYNGAMSRKGKSKIKLLGRYVVADPEICHGQPTFRGTRILVAIQPMSRN